MLAWVRMTRPAAPREAAAMVGLVRMVGLLGLLGLVAAVLLLVVGPLVSCMPPPQRMCTASTDCGAASWACVAGRCIAGGAVPAISTARRLMIEPLDVGYVRRGEAFAGGPGSAAFATLGLAGAPRMFLRFELPLQPDDTLVEAFLAVERASDVAADPTAITLHVAGVVDRWDGAKLSWGNQPRIEELGLPQTSVSAAAGSRVRLDVRDLLQRARRRRSHEVSLAVLAEGESATGLTFALTPGRVRGPELELYLR
jgi:hypothetical protein